jgi:5-methylcytosine-specific restriction protein A
MGEAMPQANFEVGRVYNRRSDIHARFGGQMQGGISTPARHPLIFAFTGSSGRRHGYADEWTPDGIFRYFGEGQEGDMTLTAGNRAIANHADEGKDLLIFDALGRGQVRFRGMFNCTSYSFEPGIDRLGNQRKAIIFHLVPIDDEIAETEAPTVVPPLPIGFAELRRRAYAAAGPARETNPSQAKRTHFLRAVDVRDYVLARAAGLCEACGKPAPFVTIAGRMYLEPHHIRRLTDGGPDDPRFVGAVCPNCHREVHHGKDGEQLNSRLQSRVSDKEAALS